MKYLKLFEDINNSGYESIRLAKLYDKVFKKHQNTTISSNEFMDEENFSPSEISKIKSYLVKVNNGNKIPWPDRRSGVYKCVNIFDNRKSITHAMGILRQNADRYLLIIYKIKDEWYYLRKFKNINSIDDFADEICYECDQIDGLLNCLKLIFNK